MCGMSQSCLAHCFGVRFIVEAENTGKKTLSFFISCCFCRYFKDSSLHLKSNNLFWKETEKRSLTEKFLWQPTATKRTNIKKIRTINNCKMIFAICSLRTLKRKLI